MREIYVSEKNFSTIFTLAKNFNIEVGTLVELIIDSLYTYCLYKAASYNPPKVLYIDGNSIQPEFSYYDLTISDRDGGIGLSTQTIYWISVFIQTSSNNNVDIRSLREDEVLSGWIEFFSQHAEAFINKTIEYR